jgi:hypothetical protein
MKPYGAASTRPPGAAPPGAPTVPDERPHAPPASRAATPPSSHVRMETTVTNDEMIAMFEALGLIPGQHWRLAKVDGRSEIVVSLPAMRILARHAPDQEAARALLAAVDERFPGQ